MRTTNPKRETNVCTMTRDKVRALLGERLVVQGRFAKAAGVDPDKLSRWLNAKGHLWYEELWLIAQKLDVTVDYLCDDEKENEAVSIPPHQISELPGITLARNTQAKREANNSKPGAEAKGSPRRK